ncbi:MAG: outer membrane protein assembly factor BamD [Verrucomicrobiota bacterium]|nr:outer membrane protein assembly factor BamD [Verrucomicrobiota bacterium]
MRTRNQLAFLCLAALAANTQAAIVFKPNQKAKYVAPGEAEVNGTAQELFTDAQEAERKGNKKRAIKDYKAIVKKYPKDTLAPGAIYRAGQLWEEENDLLRAAGAYRVLVEQYPQSVNFENAIEAQFRIGEIYLAGKKLRLFGIPLTTSMDRAVDVFAAIVRTAPYGKYTARAQFDIGLARQKQGADAAALDAFQAVVDKYPKEPIAADAQYQIGYLHYSNTRRGSNDAGSINKAETGFQDFLFRYPKSEKANQAEQDLNRLEQRATTDAFKVAKFYDKQKKYRAAVIYYNEVIRQQPSSTASVRAKRRIDQIRAKVGEDALQPAIATVDPKKKRIASSGGNSKGKPEFRGDSDVAPLPPPEQDASLPPPASLASPPTTAPEPSPTPTPESSPEAAAPTPSPTPEETATPAGP